MAPDVESQKLFLELKAICVPLLSQSRLNNKNTSQVLALLSNLSSLLKKLDEDHAWLKPALVSYTFFPLQTILSRNDSPNIPDQVLEKIFEVLELLFRWWWWTCEEGVWEQVLMLAGAVVGGLGSKGKGRERDDETKDAAVRLILCLLRDRSTNVDSIEESSDDVRNAYNANMRLSALQTHSQAEKLVSVLGQTLNALLETATSQHLPLQLHSLNVVEVVISLYVPDSVMPSILPGVVSSMTRIALGRTVNEPKGKGWVNGSVVSASLRVMDVAIIRAIGDEPCLSVNIVKEVNGLEDLTELVSSEAAASSTRPGTPSNKVYETTRSVPWLRATSSQLLIALNSLSSLISHPTPAALLALSSFSQSLLSKARLTLSESRPLLISFLLSLSNSRFPSVSQHASNALYSLLAPSEKGNHELLQTLLQHTADNLSALPRLLPTRADARIMHVAGQIEAACRLGPAGAGVGRLLGSTGHIEKWGWRLLSVIEFASPPPTIIGAGAIGLLEGVPDERIVFPMATLDNIGTRETHVALERMLRALGSAGGETCLFAIEWFARVGIARSGEASAVGALWCACRILEGVVGVWLDEDESVRLSEHQNRRSRRIEKFARWLTRAISELWDKDVEEEMDTDEAGQEAMDVDADEERLTIEFVKGLNPLETRLDIMPSKAPAATPKRQSQSVLVKSVALQLLAVSASILESRFSTLLLYALYPILHSLVQPSEHLANSAFAALQYVTRAAGSATPGNLLLSNFDYALDAVSRRLTRRRLEIDAARVLVILVRLVGRDVVQRASDVVEECFDRLDDFHGYSVVVGSLLEALHEVVKVIGSDEPPQKPEDRVANEPESIPDGVHFDNFMHWLEHRHDAPPRVEHVEDDDTRGTPRGPLGKGKSKEMTEEEQEEERKMLNEASPLDDPKPTPTQQLTAQIVSRSITLLTHGAPSIRARILVLLTTAAPVLPASSLLPAVHRAWPFIVNRLNDSETQVAAAAASFVAALTHAHGSFMAQRVWDDVWPLFRRMLARLDAADEHSALARRHTGVPGVGTESVYTHSHRLYRAMLATMTAAVGGGVQVQDRRAWDVLLSFRRFLSRGAHEELQAAARDLYVAFGEKNEDAVWLVLTSTACTPGISHLKHLEQPKWDIQQNVDIIFADLARAPQTNDEDENM
ncbi:hypothetical protein ACEPAG_39 [Sanghuangporus baumii]